MNVKSLVLLGLSITTIGTAAILGSATQASARDVKAGPIWNNEDAKVKCPVAAAAVGGEWNGQWVTTVWGKESVCGVNIQNRHTGVNGRNVKMVRHSQGSYTYLGNGNWGEANLQNEITFKFKETGRDDWSVYLLDSSRNVKLQLDLHRQQIIYTDNTQHFDLYAITHSQSRR
jgi:Mannan-binding protein